MEHTTKRNSNIELLRILCMLAIILHHSFYHSKISPNLTNINYNLLSIVQILGAVANNIFILITGYYMCNKNIKKKSIIKLIFEILFYSYFVLLINLIFLKQTGNGIIIKSIFPITANQTWFVTCYLLLYISIPFINILINNIDKKKLLMLIIFLICCFSILPTMSRLTQYFSTYTWFISLYLIGAYINRYKEDVKKKISEKDNKLLVLISSMALIILMILKMLEISFIKTDINNFIIVILAISIFMLFINRNEFYNAKINYIASSVLGIYLLHDNFILRPLIWKKVNIPGHINSPYFWIYEIGIILTIFILCFIVDKLRQKFIEKPVVDFVLNKIEKIKEIKN